MDSPGGGGVGAMRARFEASERKNSTKDQDNVSNLRNKFEKNKSQGGGMTSGQRKDSNPERVRTTKSFDSQSQNRVSAGDSTKPDNNSNTSVSDRSKMFEKGAQKNQNAPGKGGVSSKTSSSQKPSERTPKPKTETKAKSQKQTPSKQSNSSSTSALPDKKSSVTSLSEKKSSATSLAISSTPNLPEHSSASSPLPASPRKEKNSTGSSLSSPKTSSPNNITVSPPPPSPDKKEKKEGQKKEAGGKSKKKRPMSMYSSSTIGKAAATSQYAFDDSEKRGAPKRKAKPEEWSISDDKSPQGTPELQSSDSEDLSLKLDKTKNKDKLAIQKEEKISLTARLRRRKDKGKSEMPVPKDEITERKRSTTLAQPPSSHQVPQSQPPQSGKNKQGQIDGALSSWLGGGVTPSEVRKMDAQPKQAPKKKKSTKREIKRNKSKLGTEVTDLPQEQEELALDDSVSGTGTHYAFLGSSKALKSKESSQWREEDEDDIDIDALPNDEKADHFIGSIEDQEESSGFTMSQMWPPFNPVGEYKGDLKDGIPHGTGQLMFLNGKKYLGEWKLGRRDGQGKMYWPCGNVYVGGFQDDKKHGKGEEQTTRNNGVLVAEWEHGKPHGKGVLKVQGAGTFAVEWAKGKITDFRETKKT